MQFLIADNSEGHQVRPEVVAVAVATMGLRFLEEEDRVLVEAV